MLADPVVNPFVVATQDHQVFLAGEFIGHLLRKALPIGRGEDDLVVMPFRRKLRHQRKDRFDHHDHPGIPSETIVIHLTPAAFSVRTDVVDEDFDEPFPAGPLDDGMAERTFKQLG